VAGRALAGGFGPRLAWVKPGAVAGAMAPGRVHKARTGARGSRISVRQPLRPVLFFSTLLGDGLTGVGDRDGALTFPTGFNPVRQGGRCTGQILPGTAMALAPCRPAPPRTGTAQDEV